MHPWAIWLDILLIKRCPLWRPLIQINCLSLSFTLFDWSQSRPVIVIHTFYSFSFLFSLFCSCKNSSSTSSSPGLNVEFYTQPFPPFAVAWNFIQLLTQWQGRGKMFFPSRSVWCIFEWAMILSCTGDKMVHKDPYPLSAGSILAIDFSISRRRISFSLTRAGGERKRKFEH